MTGPPLPRSRRVILAIAVALVVQFALGMIVNLYVAIPQRHPGARAGDHFAGVASAARGRSHTAPGR